MSVLQAEAAIPAGAALSTGNIIRPADAFIGRDVELADLLALLGPGGPRLVTLLAPGGYGKSRLASETCMRLRGSFADGEYLLRLARLAAVQRLPQALAAAVGFQFAGTREPTEQVFDYLREKEMLLLFDNVEHVLAGVQSIADILAAAPGVRILATSRVPLRLPQERVVEVGPLDRSADGADAGCQLFHNRAAALGDGLAAGDEELIDRICGLLAGVPLSLELAAVRTRSLPLAEILTGLEASLRTEAQSATLPDWPRSLGAACRWSWGLLPPDQQQALMRLSTFRGGFFPVEAQALLGLIGPAVAELLSALCASGWLHSYDVDGQLRYSIRNTATREYAWEMLTEGQGRSGSQSQPESFYDRSRLAHARCFAQLLAAEGRKLKGDPASRGAGQLAALHRLHLLAEENIHVALDTALELEAVDCLLPLARHFGRLLEMTGGFALMAAAYPRILACALRLGNAELQIAARAGLCSLANREGRFDDCAHEAHIIAALAEHLGQTANLADARRLLGQIASTHGDYAAASALLLDALEIARASGDKSVEAGVLINLGNVQMVQGDLAAARGSLEACLALRRELGDRYGEGMALNNLGNLAQREGNVPLGIELTERCLAIRREFSDLHGQAAALGNLAIAYYRQGDIDRSASTFGQALAIQRSQGDRLGVSGTLNNLGAAERGRRNFVAAREHYRGAVALSREIGHGLAEATALLNLANIECALGHWASARGNYAAAIPALQRLGGAGMLPKAVALAGAALIEQGDAATGALALLGGLRLADASRSLLELDEQEIVDAAQEKLVVTVMPPQLKAWAAEADSLSLEAAAGLALAALAV